MKNSNITKIIIAVVTVFAFALTNPDTGKNELENLSGTYQDLKPYPYGNAWGKRVFTFDKGKWTLNFTLSLDPDMKMQVFEFRTVGTYQVLEKSQTVSDAYNALFLEDKKFLTLKTGDDKLIQGFGFASCDLKKDVEKDISITGCSAWKPVTECNQDNDLLSLDKKGNLYFGERPADNDMCSIEKRPKKLTPPVVKTK